MQGRSGPFWDGVEGRAPVPPAAATLGFEFVDADVEAGTIELAFTAREAFTNPSGNVLGGFVAAMLYDTVGPALLATLEPDQFQSTLQLSVSFLRPLRPGRVLGKGRVVPRDGDLVFLEASLTDADGGGHRHGHRDRAGDRAEPRGSRGVTSGHSAAPAFPSSSPAASTRAGPAVPWSSSEPPATRKEPRCAS
jgi:uncharacterized protein (TIGR00369 family)